LTESDRNKERSLVSELMKGNTVAFDQIFRIYGKRLYYFSLGYLKSKSEAEEVVQEVFYKIWKNRGALNPELSFKAYIFKIAYNHIQELFLKIIRERDYLNEIITSSVDNMTDMDDRMNYQSLLDLVEKLIDRLPERQKEILILRRKDGKPVKDIAAELNISPKTVENHITEAMKKLKDGLAGEHLAGILFFFLFLKN
jgi:RNA polymerase sigma-70 factor (ECF subfamily)